MKNTIRKIGSLMLVIAILASLFCFTSCKKEDAKTFTTLSDFEGATVGFLQGGIIDDIINGVIDNVSYKTYLSTSDEVAALEKGDIDAIGLDMPVAELLVAQHPEFMIFPEVVAPDQYGLVLQNNSPYTEDFTRIIDQFYEDGTIDALKEKWFSGKEELMVIDWSEYQLENRSNGTLRYRYENTLAPMGFTGNNGQAAGYEVELVLKIANELDMGVTLDPITTASLMNFISEGMADVASSCISITDEREEMIDFPKTSHYIGGLVLVCKKDRVEQNLFSQKQDFTGQTLGVLQGSSLGTLIGNVIEDVTFKEYDDVAGQIEALKRKDVVGLAMDMPIAQHVLAQNSDLSMFPEIIVDDEYGYLLPKNSSETQKFSEIIRGFYEDGTIDALKEKWFSGDEDALVVDWSAYQTENRTNGTLNCAYVDNKIPMSFKGADGRPAGFEIELLLKIADALDMGVNFIPTNFGSLINYVTSGKADVGVGGVSITEERKESVDFPDSHYIGGAVIVCRKENISAQADINLNSSAITIAVESGTVTESAARSEYPDANYIFVNNCSDGLLSVTSGRANAFAIDKGTYESAVSSGNNQIMLHHDGTIGEIGYVAVGISRKTELADAKQLIDDFLSDMEASGVLADMKQRWVEDHIYEMPEIAAPENPTMTIKIGTTGLAEPYTFHGEDGELTGFELELIKRFALWANAEIEVHKYTWDGIMAGCEAGQVDYIMSNLFATPEREEVLDFSEPYITVETVMVVAKTAVVEEVGLFESLAASFEKTFIRENRWKLIVNGLLVTLEITVFAGLFGTVLGLIHCLLIRSKNKLISTLARAWSKLIQGIPSLVVLMIIYFVIFASSSLSPVAIGILSFSLMFGVSVAGILNAGIQAVDKGQWEAASALGFTKAGCFVRIILPPAVKHALPLYVGEFVAMLKLTSIVGYISIEDLTKAGDIIRSRTYEAFFPLITTALIYFVIASIISFAFSGLEKAIDPLSRPRRLPKGVVEISGELPAAAPKAEAAVGEELIRIEHLKKVYPNATPLSDVNTTIHRGEVITIIGPSGTGKSTLMRCINRLETPTDGKIIVFGENVCDKKTDLNKIRRKMGMVFQSFHLFGHLTVIENVMLAPTVLNKQPKQEAYENAMRLLKSVGVAEKALNYPDELSGGQKQRVAIARCLAMSPEIILLDEPTSALDPTMVGEVQAVIKQLSAENYTMMIVTHEMKFAKEASTRIFYMDSGVIYEDGTPEQIFEAPKKERTRAFVKRLRTLEYTISSRNFDLYDLNSKIEEFARRHFMMLLQVKNIQLVLEEIIMNFILKKTENIRINLGFFEADATIEITLRYGDAAYNPFADEDADEISMRLIGKYVSEHEWEFTDTNQLVLKI